MVFILDIETSGLDPEVDWITCIGIFDKTGIYQFSSSAEDFASDPLGAERKLLVKYLASTPLLQELGSLVTYNGKQFDIPFITKRLFKTKIAEQIPNFSAELICDHIDLIDYVRKAEGRRLSKDEAANKHCNLYVPRNVPGAYLAKAYKHKKVTADLHAQMLQHNALDVCTTFRMYETFKNFEDFKEFLNVDNKGGVI